MDGARRLLADDLYDSRVGMAQRVDSNPGDEVQVAAAFQVINKNALAARDGQGITVVNGDQVPALELDDFSEIHCLIG